MIKTQYRICVIQEKYNKEWFKTKESTMQLLRVLRHNDKTQAAHFTKKIAINIPFKFRSSDEFESHQIFDLMTCYIEEMFGVRVSEPAKGRGRGRLSFTHTISHPLLNRIKPIDSTRLSYEHLFDWSTDQNGNPVISLRQLQESLPEMQQ